MMNKIYGFPAGLCHNTYYISPMNRQAGQKFCKDPDNHLKFVRFCLRCAKKGKKYPDIFYCAKCYSDKHGEHNNHIECYKLDSKQFKERFQAFFYHLKHHFSTSNDPSIQQIVQKQSTSCFDLHKIQDKEFRKLICSFEFWGLFDPETRQATKNKIQSKVLQIEKESGSSQIVEKKAVLDVDWGEIEGQGGSNDNVLQMLLDGANEEKKSLQKKKEILNLLIKIYASYESIEKDSLIAETDSASQKHPEEITILLGKLNLMNLHADNQAQWLKIVEKISDLDSDFKFQPAYKYLQSFQYWKLVKDPENSRSLIFIDSNTNLFYELIEPTKYVDLLSEAIVVSSGRNNSTLLSARGCGYLSLGKFIEAEKDFKRALQLQIENQTLQSNMAYSEWKQELQNEAQKQQDNQVPAFMIEPKSSAYLINAIKYFRLMREPQLISSCSNVILQANPENLFAKIQKTKSLIKSGDLSNATEAKNQIAQKIPQSDMDKIQRQLQYAIAKKSAENKSYQDATQKYRQIVKQKDSASACFNLAASLYNQQKFDEAYEWIEKALAKKPQDMKYLNLKFHIYMMKKEIDKAKAMLPGLDQSSIKPELIETLNRF